MSYDIHALEHHPEPTMPGMCSTGRHGYRLRIKHPAMSAGLFRPVF
ncbi:hypothetical protein [Desulfonatronospira thiodismutans]|nr:hypothetical protein [Desulfonatronospira thiodismutans]